LARIKTDTGDAQVDAENELSPSMKIFAWRGPSRTDMMDLAPEITASSASGFVPNLAESIQSAAPLELSVEIRLAGAVVSVVHGFDEALLTEVLRAVRRSAPKPIGSPSASTDA
jgi:hypothetical protein